MHLLLTIITSLDFNLLNVLHYDKFSFRAVTTAALKIVLMQIIKTAVNEGFKTISSSSPASNFADKFTGESTL